MLHGPYDLDVDLFLHMLHPADVVERDIGFLHEHGEVVFIELIFIIGEIPRSTANPQLAVQLGIGELGMDVEQLLIGPDGVFHMVFLQRGA